MLIVLEDNLNRKKLIELWQILGFLLEAGLWAWLCFWAASIYGEKLGIFIFYSMFFELVNGSIKWDFGAVYAFGRNNVCLLSSFLFKCIAYLKENLFIFHRHLNSAFPPSHTIYHDCFLGNCFMKKKLNLGSMLHYVFLFLPCCLLHNICK